MAKRKRARVPKSKRRNLKMWAEGARESILAPHIEPYADSMERGWRYEREYFQQICNEFHARIDWRLEDHEEPVLPLEKFDPKAPLPDLEKLPEAEETRRQQRTDQLNARIRRWFKYRVKRLRRHVRTKVNSSKDPWSVFLAKLSGITAPPKARQGFQQFMREMYQKADNDIEELVKEKWAATPSDGASVATSAQPNAPFRAKVVRELFAALPEEERAEYKARAVAEATLAREKFDKALKDPPATSPQARQTAIDSLGAFVAPILQGIFDRTGLHSCLLLGGPIPKYGGDLRTIHVSFGRNRSAAKSHFPQWDKPRFNSGVLALMKEYLETVFNKQDSADAALPTGLEGAKFTIDPDDSDSDSDDSNDSSSSEEESDEEDAPARKKSKEATQTQSKPKPKGKKTTVKAKKDVPAAKTARDLENERLANIDRVKSLLQPVVDGFAADKERWRQEDAAAASKKAPAASASKKVAPKRKVGAEVGAEQQEPRKSRRLQDEGGSRTDENTPPAGQAVKPPAVRPLPSPNIPSAQPSHPTHPAPPAPPSQPTHPAPPAPPSQSSSSDDLGGVQNTLPSPLPSALPSQPTHSAQPAAPSHTPPLPPSSAPSSAPPAQPSSSGDDDGGMQNTPPLPPSSAPSSAPPSQPSPTHPAPPAPPSQSSSSDDLGGVQNTLPSPLPSALPSQPTHSTQPAAPSHTPPLPPSSVPPTPPSTAPPSQPSSSGDNVGGLQTGQPPSAPSMPPAPPLSTVPAPSAAAVAHMPTPSSTLPSNDDGSDAPPSAFEFDEDAPAWLRENVRVLSHVDLGCHFKSLLEALIRVEQKFGFEKNPQNGVSGDDRPGEIQQWIKAGRGVKRKSAYDARVKDLGDYEGRWWKWWDSLQPKWRQRGPDKMWEIRDEYLKEWEWDEFWFPGQNGCLCIVASLYFWGSSSLALGGSGVWDEANRTSWERAVRDVVWILEGLEQALPPRKKKRVRS
ncbi:hypothetical protein DFH06DRAFT_1343945 [Mycena polygramma]|nr:hypothetical protein DFH06DRAFT_1343945 [Mycena polygramma]